MTAKSPSRASGSLTISFGLVSVPVQVFGGIEDSGIKRNRFNKSTGNPVGMQNFDKETGEILGYDALELRYTTDDGSIVELTDDEIAAAANASNGFAEVVAFVKNENLSRYHQEGVSQLRPENGKKGKNTPAQKAFVLLTKAMEDRDVFALVRYCLRGKPRIGAFTSDGYLRTLAFADEVREALPLPEATVTDQELAMAGSLVDVLMDEEGPELEDEASAKIRAYANTKAAGGDVSIEEHEVGETVDLMAALTASVQAAEAS